MKTLTVTTYRNNIPFDVEKLAWHCPEQPPELPKGLLSLQCDLLGELPELPDSLEKLYCNLVTKITALPENLIGLWANATTTLPELPNSLLELYCNSITELPTLPNELCVLYCGSLIELPDFPKSLKVIHSASVIKPIGKYENVTFLTVLRAYDAVSERAQLMKSDLVPIIESNRNEFQQLLADNVLFSPLDELRGVIILERKLTTIDGEIDA